jgi:alpha-L-fucosidase
MMKYTSIALMAVLAFATSPAHGAEKTLEQRQDEFLDLKFGMFIHYNMATYHDTQWVEGYPDPSTFDPGGTVDTDAWAEAAKAAGMEYAVLTTKHVAGFCLWDSKYTEYDVMHPECPYQKDLVAQFVKSFTDRGLKVGLYYCWRFPRIDRGDRKGRFKVLPPECDPAEHTFEEQIEFQKKQIAELVENYPEAFYIWNDGLDTDIMPAEEATKFFRDLRPNLLASGNWADWGKKGRPYLDIVVSEKRHLGRRHLDNQTVGETCWCLERKWFFSGGPTKTAADLVKQLRTANSRNANFLLNVGPDKKGRIHPDSVDVLREMGRILAAEEGKTE